MPRNRLVLFGIAILGVIGGIAAATRRPAAPSPDAPIPVPTTEARGAIVALGRVEGGRGPVIVASDVAGVVSKVPVDLDDSVAAGAPLVELSRDAVRADAQAAQRREEAARARIAASEANLAQLHTKRDAANRAVVRVQAGADAGGQSAQQLDDARLTVASLRSDIAVQEATLRELRAIADQAAAETQAARARVDQRVVRAPFAGRVLRLGVLPGAAVVAGSELIELVPGGPQVVRCEVDELFADAVRGGTGATIRRLGSNRVLGSGSVTVMAPGLVRKSLFSQTAGEAEDRRVREVRVRLAGAARLPYNARVECVIAQPPTPSGDR